jgi:hypothetical protein
MTEQPPKPSPRKGVDRLTVALLAAAAFLLVFAFLTVQLSSATAKRQRTVVVRRIYETRVVEKAVGGARGGTTVTQLSSGAYSAPLPASTGSSR